MSSRLVGLPWLLFLTGIEQMTALEVGCCSHSLEIKRRVLQLVCSHVLYPTLESVPAWWDRRCAKYSPLSKQTWLLCLPGDVGNSQKSNYHFRLWHCPLKASVKISVEMNRESEKENLDGMCSLAE